MKKLNTSLVLLFFFVCCQFGFTQTQKLTRDQVNDSIKKMPSFSIHKDIYFITGIPINEEVSSETADVKYQISFKLMVTRNTLPWDTHLFLAYSQKSFWDIYKESSPFNDINFNPAIGLGKAIYNKKDELIGLASFGLEHESNGRDSIYSRSWNSFFLTYNTKIGKKTRLESKAWLPFMYRTSNNPDLMDYIGLGEAKIAHNFIPNKLMFDVMLRKGLEWDWKGAIRTRLYYRPFKEKSNQYLMLEWYNGYAESLIDYTQHTSMIRIGYVIKTNESKLLN